MGKRASGSPRRPRDPVAKAARTPRFKQPVLPDKRGRGRPPGNEDVARPHTAPDEGDHPTD